MKRIKTLEVYTTLKMGEIAGAIVATPLPDIPCKCVIFKAQPSNAGNVYLGGVGVTIPDGTTDATSGYPLDASQETPLLYIDNLNRLSRICDNAGDDISYLALDD